MTDESLITSPLKAIRAKCLDCNYTSPEVKACPCKACPLYHFRFGKNPFRKRKMTDEQKAASVARLAAFREKNKKG